MNTEDEEFNRIEREASLRQAAVKATVAKKEWIGLSEQELYVYPTGFHICMRFVESLLKEKNK